MKKSVELINFCLVLLAVNLRLGKDADWLWKSHILITPGATGGNCNAHWSSSEGAEYEFITPLQGFYQMVSLTPGCTRGYSYYATYVAKS